jgi:hypothetical protein
MKPPIPSRFDQWLKRRRFDALKFVARCAHVITGNCPHRWVYDSLVTDYNRYPEARHHQRHRCAYCGVTTVER